MSVCVCVCVLCVCVRVSDCVCGCVSCSHGAIGSCKIHIIQPIFSLCAGERAGTMLWLYFASATFRANISPSVATE